LAPRVKQVSKSLPPVALAFFCEFIMYLLYLDEFGHAGRWVPNDPLHNHHPLFGLAGFAVPGMRWADLDRQFYRLKCDIYKKEIFPFAISKGERQERFEPKQLKSRRDLIFAAEVLNLVRQNQGHVFAFGYQKSIDHKSHRDHALYIGCVENSMLNFEEYLKEHGGKQAGRGVVIMDRRNDALNGIVLGAAQSFLFGRSRNQFGRSIDRIVEAPMLVPSEYYHGVQMADMIGRATAAVHLHRLGLRKGLAKLEAILEPKLDGHAFAKGAWTTVTLKLPQNATKP
jgi:hypothetical protein